jgi:hypothetical protein
MERESGGENLRETLREKNKLFGDSSEGVSENSQKSGSDSRFVVSNKNLFLQIQEEEISKAYQKEKENLVMQGVQQLEEFYKMNSSQNFSSKNSERDLNLNTFGKNIFPQSLVPPPGDNLKSSQSIEPNLPPSK